MRFITEGDAREKPLIACRNALMGNKKPHRLYTDGVLINVY